MVSQIRFPGLMLYVREFRRGLNPVPETRKSEGDKEGEGGEWKWRWEEKLESGCRIMERRGSWGCDGDGDEVEEKESKKKVGGN